VDIQEAREKGVLNAVAAYLKTARFVVAV